MTSASPAKDREPAQQSTTMKEPPAVEQSKVVFRVRRKAGGRPFMIAARHWCPPLAMALRRVLIRYWAENLRMVADAQAARLVTIKTLDTQNNAISSTLPTQRGQG